MPDCLTTDETFRRLRARPETFAAFGFAKHDGGWKYIAPIVDGMFSCVITISEAGEVFEQVVDCATGDEYVQHRIASAVGAFVGRVRQEVDRLLGRIAAACFERDVFKTDLARRTIDFARKNWGDELEFLWKQFPDYAVLRRKDTQTWYAVLMRLPRCLAADLDPASPGVEFCGASMLGVFAFAGNKTSQPKSVASYNAIQNYAVWWSGDMRRQSYNGNALWNYSVWGNRADFVRGFEGTGTNNASKQAPCLAADIFGDWREELVLRREDNRAIRIYMTDMPTPYRFHTFLEDPVYRSSVATENVDYNQPTHTGFYFGPDLLGRGIWFRGTFLP